MSDHDGLESVITIVWNAHVEGLLPVERQAIGIFGDGDLARSASVGMPPSMIWAGAGAWITPSAFLNAYLGRRVTITRNFAGTTSRRSETSSPISHLLLAGRLSQLFRLNDSFDPFQMGRKALAPTRCTLAIHLRTALADLGLDGGDAGLDLLEDKGLLFIVAVRRAELFRSSAEPGAVEGLQDLRQLLDARIGVGVAALRSATSLSRASVRAAFSAIASTMAFSVSMSFGRLRSGGVIDPTRAHFAPLLLPF